MNNISNFSVPPPFGSPPITPSPNSCICPPFPSGISCVKWSFNEMISVAVVSGTSFGFVICGCAYMIHKYNKTNNIRRKITGFFNLEPIPETKVINLV